MIISDLRKCLHLLPVLLLIAGYAAGQNLQPAPDLQLLSSGYGAAGLGMGGAFNAVADDLSAIYWNPAGASQINGMQFYADYSFATDSDADYAAEVTPNRFDSPQRFSISGNQFRAFSAAYTFETKSYRFTPLVSWQKTSLNSPERDLKETAGVVNFLSPSEFYQSEGTFTEKTDGSEHEWAIGMSALVSKKILIGGTFNILSGKPETKVNGTFHNSFVNSQGTTRNDSTLDQTTTEDVSGNYFKFGMLFFPQGPVRLGGTVRFPYTRTSTLTVQRRGNITDDTGSTPIQEDARAETSIDVPMEWSIGVALASSGAIVAASVTSADWSTTERVVTGSSDTLVIPNDTLLYPLLRAGGLQSSLLQYRIGTEYRRGQSGVVMRAGYFWDGQPYGNGDRTYLRGFTAGAGYMSRAFRVDFAYFSENGDVRLTAFSAEDSHISQRRILVSLSLLSQ